jgi:peptide chain release factor 2
MAEINHKQFWLNETNSIEENIELLADLISLPKLDEKIINEAAAEIKRINNKIKDLDAKLLLGQEDDIKNCILTIHPGAGGTESCDWAEMLFRMYLRWLQMKKFSYRILNQLPGDVTQGCNN